MPKITHEEVQKRLKEHNFALVGSYNGYLSGRQEIECLSCGHVKEYKVVNATLGKCKCKKCQMEENVYPLRMSKFLPAIEEKGFTLLSDWKGEDDRALVEMQCNSCGETIERQVCSPYWSKDFKCPYCQGHNTPRDEYRVSQELESRGYRFVRFEGQGKTRKVHGECFSCGHQTVLYVNNIVDYSLAHGKTTACKYCSYSRWVEQKAFLLEDHGYRLLDFDYRPRGSSVDYMIRCKSCDNEFLGNIYSFTKERSSTGQCPSCMDGVWGGFNKDRPGTFYYLRVENPDGSPLYKIGITNRTVEQRFCKEDLAKITVLRELHFDIGRKAYDLERYYLDTFASFKYSGDPVLKSGGNTELFTRNIFGIS